MTGETERIAEAARQYVVACTAYHDNLGADYAGILERIKADAWRSLYALVWAEDARPSETQTLTPPVKELEQEHEKRKAQLWPT
jgi:hypothetical protein